MMQFIVKLLMCFVEQEKKDGNFKFRKFVEFLRKAS